MKKEMKWTDEQSKVIAYDHRNILVSAAAGSGKTAVLVERIIRKITDSEHPVDVDKLLVVTFTKAAAAEMRERIGAAIESAMAEQPENVHLQKQGALLHNAQITTIDSFCLYVVKNYFHRIDLEPGFRIADEGECALLRSDVLEELMEQYYEKADDRFYQLADAFGNARNDDAIKEMIADIHRLADATPWPLEWIEELRMQYAKGCEDARDILWLEAMNAHFQGMMESVKAELEMALHITEEADGPYMYRETIAEDIGLVESFLGLADYDAIYQALQQMPDYAKLKAARGFEGDADKKELVQSIRNDVMKKTFKECKEKLFFQPIEKVQQGLIRMQPMANVLLELAHDYYELFLQKKREKNILDFSDIEHLALQILVDCKTKEPTEVAQELRDYFAEIMIDEYQDSNYLQEAILTAISKEAVGAPNMFMVGDIKQSIYRFRQARVELFMGKYDTYSKDDSLYQKIELRRNFRSRESVLQAINDIFYKIMGRDFGNIIYDEDAALYTGADYPNVAGADCPEIILADREADEQDDRRLLEADVIIQEIRRLHGTYQVQDKASGELRPARYADMVILLRSPGTDAQILAGELNDAGIPAHTVTKSGYFQVREIEVLLNYLAILDNPLQDIPMASVLGSWFGKLTQVELAYIKAYDTKRPFCENVQKIFYAEDRDMQGDMSVISDDVLYKLESFRDTYDDLRKKSRYLPIHELLYEIFKASGYLEYITALPGGQQRRANVEMLTEKAVAYESTSYRGLFHFIRYIEKLRKYNVEMGEAEIVSENEDAVRIMSIHKSKGMEFPICIVSGLGRQFNLMDSRKKLVVHPQLGIAMDEYDVDKHVKIPTLSRKILAQQLNDDSKAEELRVLYVALTRAKEKLIMIGSVKDVEKNLARWQAQARTDGFLSYLTREKASGYLDWIMPAILSYPKKYPVRIYEGQQEQGEELIQAVQTGLEKEELLHRIKKQEGLSQELADRLTYVYPYREEIALKSKVSVSELKHRAMEQFEQSDWEHEALAYVPSFIQEPEENQGALRGTAMHRAMECIDFAMMQERITQAGIESTETALQPIIENRLAELLEEKKLDEEMYALLMPHKIATFFTHDIAMRLSKAQTEKMLFLEKPFVLGKKACDIYPDMKSEEAVLIQGIVDVFFVEENKVHILDYKTDRVQNEEQLLCRYRTQLDLYAEALAHVFEMEVGEKIIYSFALNKAIVW